MNKTIEGVACVVYPESCDIDNIYEYIFPNFPCALSPLHCRDKSANGELKKSHYHLLFKGKLSEKNKTYIGKILGIKFFENIYDIVEYYHYLYHFSFRKNDWLPNKASYWKIDIKTSDTFNLDDVSEKLPIEVLKEYANAFHEISDFSDFVFAEKPEYIEEFMKHFHFFDRYINSNRYREDKALFHTYNKIIQEQREEIKKLTEQVEKLNNKDILCGFVLDK